MTVFELVLAVVGVGLAIRLVQALHGVLIGRRSWCGRTVVALIALPDGLAGLAAPTPASMGMLVIGLAAVWRLVTSFRGVAPRMTRRNVLTDDATPESLDGQIEAGPSRSLSHPPRIIGGAPRVRCSR